MTVGVTLLLLFANRSALDIASHYVTSCGAPVSPAEPRRWEWQQLGGGFYERIFADASTERTMVGA